MKVDRTHSVSASVCSTVPRRISYAVNGNVSERVRAWVNRGRRGWDGMGWVDKRMGWGRAGRRYELREDGSGREK